MKDLVRGLALEEPKLGTAEQELQCWEGVGGVKGGGSTACLFAMATGRRLQSQGLTLQQRRCLGEM